jgi:hypothetical protein
MTTPNTAANGGQILTDERIAEIADATGMMAKNDVLSGLDGGLICIDFARAIEADLRASHAAVPASEPVATFDTERASMVAKFGDCCNGGDPMCAGGCLVVKAIRRAAPLPAAPAPTEQAGELPPNGLIVPNLRQAQRHLASIKKVIDDSDGSLYLSLLLDDDIEMLGNYLAARQAPTEAPKESLSEAQLDHIARSYFAEPHAQENAKNAIHDAFLEVRQAPASRDAERYRWLLERFIGYDFYWGGKPDAEAAADRGKVVAVIEVGETFRGGRDFSSAIDAAREKAQ